jgi:alpha/beta superfamily hydrolase
MSKTRILVPAAGVSLEARLDEVPGEKAVVVTHPHPLYGGNMHNNVVEAVAEAYRQQGYCTLKFNFRSVEQSGGDYDGGTGEQSDVEAALDYLHEQGKTSIDLAGYSFGAWVNARGIKRFDHVKRMIMVAPPVGFLDFSFLSDCPKLKLVIAGSGDDIAPAAMIEKMISTWNPQARLKIISGADHFFRDETDELIDVIGRFLSPAG